ncbi:MAG TPA: hypothetical protein VF576_05575 [Rubricoccaceae bacterium]|jgi:hypothetical protein
MLRPALSVFHPTTPPDVRRAVHVLLTVSGLSLLYAGLYGHVYVFRTGLGLGLPDVSTGADVLVTGLGAVALFTAAWAIGLALASTPSFAAGLRDAWARASSAADRWPVAWAVAVVLAALYAVARVAWNGECAPATLDALTAGAARTPFQYRALVPAAVQHAVSVVPALGRSLWLPYGAVEAAAALGAWAATRSFLRPYVAGGEGGRSLAALLVFVLLALNLATPVRHNALFFPWDTLSVALFTGGLALMHQRRWGLYYVLFVVATFNRETTCFLTVALVLSEWGHTPLRRLAAHGAAQLALWVGVKALMAAAYAGNPALGEGAGESGLFILPYVMNLGAVSGVPGLLMLTGTMGGLWLVPALLAGRVSDPGLRRLFRFVPLFLVGMLVVGEVLEVRIYSELIPLVVAALAVSLRSVVVEAAGGAGAGAETCPGRGILPRRERAVVAGGQAPRSRRAGGLLFRHGQRGGFDDVRAVRRRAVRSSHGEG